MRQVCEKMSAHESQVYWRMIAALPPVVIPSRRKEIH